LITMTPDVPAQFERDTNGTEAQWLGWLPAACGAHTLRLPAPQQAEVQIGHGHLSLRWHTLPPRRIALVTLPRLQVAYAFSGLNVQERISFMRYFDLVMQRGGG